ncbi:MAG: phospholipase A1 [Colwellia sp.]|jgi:phospholipase A1
MTTKKFIQSSILSVLIIVLSITSFYSNAEFEKQINGCIYETIKSADKTKTLQQIEDFCAKTVVKENVKIKQLGLISERILKERENAFNPFVITPHRMNYILPVLMTDGINKDAYDFDPEMASNLKDVEAKFQLSIKVPLTTSHLLTKGDKIYFGFTLESWWQLYSEEISRPFRETNYQPEFFYFAPLDWHPIDSNSAIVLGFQHQSNGRTQLVSRSWNRIYANFLFEKNNIALSFKPWFRIPEGDKVTSENIIGDDNPDIEDFMGHFELSAVYKWRGKYEFSMKARENFTEHNGAIELGMTFPLWGNLKGYVQYFNGYGESLVDYNYSQQRFGIGIALSDIL